jgi:rhodanese-related sulfurtransferase
MGARGRRRWTALLGLGSLTGCARPGPTWPEILREVRERHPEVEQLSLESLQARIDGPDAPLLLDARPPEEFVLGHLQGARCTADLEAALDGAGPETEIVVYCSVGMRSADLAQQLSERGFERVANLEGGIFRWVNQGGATWAATVAGGQESRVDVVHPFDERWGTLLAPGKNALVR